MHMFLGHFMKTTAQNNKKIERVSYWNIIILPKCTVESDDATSYKHTQCTKCFYLQHKRHNSREAVYFS